MQFDPTQPAARKKIEQYSYALCDRIGKGYSSIVYRGRNDQTNETVAIKVIDMKGVRDEFGKEMLECQIEALKTLKHPNILRCYDVFTTANNCYIITEFCNDGDLAGLLTKRRRMTESETVGYLRQIISGFVQIADSNFLHRDLKLANIFLSNGVAKIADFGFAKKNKNPGQKEKYNVGSPLYMSPEALKKNIYSVKNDIWSIGVILYELLHGETPWECKTEKQLMDKIVRVPVAFPVKISEQLKSFLKKCLEVDQSKRMSLDDLKNSPYLKQQRSEPLGKLDLNKKASQNKENISSQLGRATVDKNNQIIVHYINMFRLLFKMVSALSENRPEQKKLIQLISNQVLERVSYLKTLSSAGTIKVGALELKDSERYFSEATNPSIKKYKIVIAEYYKKYNGALKSEQLEGDLQDSIKSFLRTSTLKDPAQVMQFHWMVEYMLLPKDQRKDCLEAIIEPKSKPSIESVQSRLRMIA